MILQYTESQKWLLLKALCELTTMDAQYKLREEFPELNHEEFVQDLEELVFKLSGKKMKEFGQ